LLGLALAAQGTHDEAFTSAAHSLRLSPSDRLVDFYASRAIEYAHLD
jgi:hypothetical protein